MKEGWLRPVSYTHLAFREWFCPFGAIGVICIGLAAGPSGDGVLQVIEYFDIYVCLLYTSIISFQFDLCVRIGLGEVSLDFVYMFYQGFR